VQDVKAHRASAIADALRSLVSATKFAHLRSSVAYASHKGATEFIEIVAEASKHWLSARKEWLVSIDFGQTSPEAIELLASLDKSEVRIADGRALLASNLIPARSFHPKSFVFTDSVKRPCAQAAILHGSANLTFGALHMNAEQVSTIRLWGESTKADEFVHAALATYDAWWDVAWSAGTRVSAGFMDEYRQQYEPAPHLQDRETLSQTLTPTNTEVGLEEGTRWATARCFWIETYELYKNRGPDKPGNQLDCRRGTRVFFGYTSEAVPRNTVFGDVEMRCEGKEPQTRSIRFGNNSMDKVNLPVPGEFGPESYDNSVLHFERLAAGRFLLSVGNTPKARLWRMRSQRQGLLYKFPGGRRYGFYD
jgi:HKD family nuclease